MLEGRHRQDPVAEIEDVSRPSARPREHVVGCRKHPIERTEEHRGIQIPLNRAVEADAPPRFVERRPPVGADDVAAGVAQVAENGTRADAEVNRGHAVRGQPFKDPPGVGQDELAIVAPAQRPHPGIEDLHGVDTCFNLRHQVVADDIGQQLTETVPSRGSPVHQRFGMRKRVRMAALDCIGGERERCAGKADQRHAAGELALSLADRVEHVFERLARLETPDAPEIGLGPQRSFDRRPFAVNEIERDAHRLERKQQIGKQDCGVDFYAPYGLERDLSREIGRAAQIEQRIALAQRAVFAHVSARLTHEPHRRRVDRLLPAGVEESPSGLDQWVTLSRFRARPTRSSSHSGLNRSSAPSSCSSVDTASSRK